MATNKHKISAKKIAILTIMLAGLILTISLLQKQQNLQQEAAVSNLATCGSNAKTYYSTATRWPSTALTAFCSRGKSPKIMPKFPYLGGSTKWVCTPVGAGGSNAYCTASRRSGP